MKVIVMREHATTVLLYSSFILPIVLEYMSGQKHVVIILRATIPEVHSKAKPPSRLYSPIVPPMSPIHKHLHVKSSYMNIQNNASSESDHLLRNQSRRKRARNMTS